ncbi:MAG TPA: GntR family transcriptional regulator [Pseudonocardiaceae bacterium]|jgi:DNA-binding GntR family transcriptional regulator|nr:GntR family transcriptional regulator [Pseudonocardiaceae bacterium]
MAFSPASIPIDRNSPVPLYYQVAQVLEQAIESGELAAGARLDNEIALAESLGLSRPTMRRAIQYLVDRGLLVRKRGVGTQVVHRAVRRGIQLTSLYEDLAGEGRDPQTEILQLDTAPATDTVAHQLGIPEGEQVLRLERLRYADGEPLALLRNYLPAGLVSVTAESLRQTGLYQLMRATGIRLHLASQVIGARSATAAEARMLKESRGASLLTMSRTAYDETGRAVEYGDHIYRASLYSFEFVLGSN